MRGAINTERSLNVRSKGDEDLAFSASQINDNRRGGET
jgi:hypothetical protein